MVDFPLPVTPHTRTNPRDSWQNFDITLGSANSLKSGIFVGICRKTIATEPRCRNALPRNRPRPGTAKEKSTSFFTSKIFFCRTEINDYGQIIEWAGTQPWSNGKVALHGVSYLAICQWYAAALQPPHLAAIVPWEGASDSYRNVMFHGGVPETAFFRGWSRQMADAKAEEKKGPSRTPPILR